MPTTILDNESYPEALQRRYEEETKAEKLMATDEIIRMAREAGMDIDDEASGFGAIITAEPLDLERFAALVAAHERELCAKVVDHILKEGGGTYGDAIRARSEK